LVQSEAESVAFLDLASDFISEFFIYFKLVNDGHYYYNWSIDIG